MLRMLWRIIFPERGSLMFVLWRLGIICYLANLAGTYHGGIGVLSAVILIIPILCMEFMLVSGANGDNDIFAVFSPAGVAAWVLAWIILFVLIVAVYVFGGEEVGDSVLKLIFSWIGNFAKFAKESKFDEKIPYYFPVIIVVGYVLYYIEENFVKRSED